jgi:hypothetical protein
VLTGIDRTVPSTLPGRKKNWDISPRLALMKACPKRPSGIGVKDIYSIFLSFILAKAIEYVVHDAPVFSCPAG